MSRLAFSVSLPALVAVFALSVSTHANADVYRYVDAQGRVQYTDKPDLLPAEILAKIKSQRTDRAAVAERTAAEQEQSTANKPTDAAGGADSSKAQQTTAADKAARCTKAREHYEQLMTAQRVYSTDEKGNRNEMNDKQIAQSRASAKQMMDTWCN